MGFCSPRFRPPRVRERVRVRQRERVFFSAESRPKSGPQPTTHTVGPHLPPSPHLCRLCFATTATEPPAPGPPLLLPLPIPTPGRCSSSQLRPFFLPAAAACVCVCWCSLRPILRAAAYCSPRAAEFGGCLRPRVGFRAEPLCVARCVRACHWCGDGLVAACVAACLLGWRRWWCAGLGLRV